MNDIKSKAEHARKTRSQFDQTWSAIAPKLTLYGILDETVGQLMNKRRSVALLSAVAVTGAAWLFNTLHVRQNPFKFSKSKSSTVKKEIKNNESPNNVSRHD